MELTIEFVVPKIALTTGKGPAICQQELQAATEFGTNLLLGAVLPLVPVDRGSLRGSIQSRVYGEGLDLVGKVFSPMQHALPVERGSKPHWPPISAIEGWVRRKLDVDPKEVRSVAYLIARSISKRGTKPHFMFRRGFDASRGRIEARYAQALARITQRLAT